MYRWTYGFVAGLAAISGTIVPAAPSGPPAAAAGPAGTYSPVETVRLIDTRNDDGLISTPDTKLSAGTPLDVRLTNRAGIPSTGVAAIDLNVTAVGMTAKGFVSVYPCLEGNDGTSRLNYAPRDGQPGYAVAVQVLAVPDANGHVCFEVSESTHLIVDTSGWLAVGGAFTAVPAERLHDSRTGEGVLDLGIGQLAPEVPVALDVGSLLPDGAIAAALSIVAVRGEAPGFMSVFPCSSGYQDTSNLNYRVSTPVANAVTAPIDEDGMVCVRASTAVDYIVDLVGYYADGRGFNALAPGRVADTRFGTGGVPVGRLGSFEELAVNVAGSEGIPETGADAVSLNVTATSGTALGYLAVYPCADGFQNTSSVNYLPFEAVPNSVFTPIDPDGSLCFLASSPVQLIVDVNAWFGVGVEAVDDTATVQEDASATAIPVLKNDTGATSISSVTQPPTGTVKITGGGTGLTYRPDVNACTTGSTDDFTYTVSPGGDLATVRVTVACVDDAPTAVNDTKVVAEDAAPTVIAVRANDTDIDGGPMTVSKVTQPPKGTASVSGAGTTVTYTPDADACTTGGPADVFTYTLTPGGDTATVAVTITCVDDAPVAIDDEFVSDASDPGGLTDRNAIGNTRLRVGGAPTPVPERALSGSLLANDADVDSALSVTGVQGAADLTDVATDRPGGTVTVAADGTFVYDPPVGFTGTDGFDYEITGGGTTSTATVTIEVADMVWYVDSSAVGPGSGTASDPLPDLAQLTGGGDLDSPGETIFLHAGTVWQTADAPALALENDQRLIGAPAGLVVGGATLATPEPGTPLLRSSTGVGIELADGVLVDSVGTFLGSTRGIRGDGVGNVTLHDVSHDGQAQVGIELVNLTGPASLTGTTTVGGDTTECGVSIESSSSAAPVTIDDLAVSGGGCGIRLLDNAGEVTVVDGAIDDNASFGVSIDGGDAPVTIGADIGTTTTNFGPLRVWDRTGGAVTFTGEIADTMVDLVIGGTNTIGTAIGTVDFDGPVTLTGLLGGPTDGPGVNVESPYSAPNAADVAMVISFNAPLSVLTKQNGDAVRLTSDHPTTQLRILGGLEIDNTTGGGTGTVARGLVTSGGTLVVADAPGVGETIRTGSGQALSVINVDADLDLDEVSVLGSSTPFQLFNAIPGAQLTIVDIETLDLTGASFNAAPAWGVDSFRVGDGTIDATNARGLDLFDIGFVDVSLSAVAVNNDGGADSALRLRDLHAGTVVIDAFTTAGAIDAGIVATGNGAAITFGSIDIGAPATVASYGVQLENNTGPIDLGTGDITNPIGTAFRVSGGTGDISFAGTITNATGIAVDVLSRTAGTVTLSGPVTHTGADRGVWRHGTAGGSLRLLGGVSLTSTGGTPFQVDGGTIEVAGTTNVVSGTGTDRAVSIENAQIGAAGVTFQTVSGSGNTSGIWLMDVSGPGGFSVTGDGAAGSGGSIANTAGSAIWLTAVAEPVLLRQMSITNPAARIANILNTDVTFESVTATGAGAVDEAVQVLANGGSAHSFTWTGTPSLRSSLSGFGVGDGIGASTGAVLDVHLDMIDIDDFDTGVAVTAGTIGVVHLTVGDPGVDTAATPGGRVVISNVDLVGLDARATGGGVLTARIDELRVVGAGPSEQGVRISGTSGGKVDAEITDSDVGATAPVGGSGVVVFADSASATSDVALHIWNSQIGGNIGVNAFAAQANGRLDLTVQNSAVSGSTSGVYARDDGGQACVDFDDSLFGGGSTDVTVQRVSGVVEVAGLVSTLAAWLVDGGNQDLNDSDPIESSGLGTLTSVPSCRAPVFT